MKFAYAPESVRILLAALELVGSQPTSLSTALFLLSSSAIVVIAIRMNPAKRRRLDATASTLSKPFRSPLKVTANCQPTNLIAKADDADSQVSTFLKSGSSTAVSARPAASSWSKKPGEEIDVTSLQREYAALSQQLRKLRQDLDAVEQAHQIQSTNQEEKLNAATLKWRNIARDAADEVFESASNRVKDMGGLRAWQKHSISNSNQDRFSDWCDTKEERPSSDTTDAFDEHTTKSNTREHMPVIDQENNEEDKEVVCQLSSALRLALLANNCAAIFHHGHNATAAQY